MALVMVDLLFASLDKGALRVVTAPGNYLFALALAACGHGGGALPDATDGDAALADAALAGSRCALQGSTLTCTSHAVMIGGRTVAYEVPLGAPPAAGWPSVIYYQGSFVPGSHAFSAAMGAALGQYELTLTVAALLDRGYAVIAPDAANGGTLFWQTNVPPYATSWTGCADDVFVKALLAAEVDGTFGPLDPSRRYAMGISSGGFMTSRMAVSYAGTFRALVVHSGSYATCSATCNVPDLPADHPPTLFLHGDADMIVPLSIMTPYRDKLLATGHVASTVIHAGGGHEWLPEGKVSIPDWFDTH
jgi:poly(3-hydroxyoctanoate) depolymerase